jgi:hypothetical protein
MEHDEDGTFLENHSYAKPHEKTHQATGDKVGVTIGYFTAMASLVWKIY